MEHPDLRRILGPFEADCIVVGAVIGVLIGSSCDATLRSAALIGAAWIASAALCYAVFSRRSEVPPVS